jgi:peptidyl-prolyl cis-trans isomerase B (cyclophilin B)
MLGADAARDQVRSNAILDRAIIPAPFRLSEEKRPMHILMTLCVPCLLLMLAAGCDESKPAGGETPQDAKSRPTTGPSAARTGKADSPVVKLETSEGTIMLELNRVKAPKTVENFLSYVRKGFYEGTTFHRIIASFMIQGGGMTESGGQKPTDKAIENEADNGLQNVRGSLAMARTGEPHSATSQFFINVVDNTALNHTAKTPRGWGYCVFGKVQDEASMKVVDAIRNTPVSGESPVKPIKITKATIVSE